MNFVSKLIKQVKLNHMQHQVNKLYKENNYDVNDEIIDKQVEINTLRNELDLPDKKELVYENFVQ